MTVPQSRHLDAIDAGIEINAWIERLAARLPAEGDRHVDYRNFERGDGGVVAVWHDNVPVGIAIKLRDAFNWTVLSLWEREARAAIAGPPAGRLGDMDPDLGLVVSPDGDGDWNVSIGIRPGGMPATLEDGRSATIEFCTAIGGGRSPRVRAALRELRAAIEADNAEAPAQAIRVRGCLEHEVRKPTASRGS